MLAGPIFLREALTLPRQFRHYLLRSGYVALLLVLMWTARQAIVGLQGERSIGELARLGGFIFQVLAVVQFSLVLFFALIFAAGGIAQEKDRGTLVLLLMTDLRDREIVLGKLFSSLLNVAVLLSASFPVFVLLHWLGGVEIGQILWVLALTAATALAAGSWGAMVAFWREKTFQTLAVSVLGVVLYLGAAEGAAALTAGSPAADWGAALDPYRALWAVLNPLADARPLGPPSHMPSVLAMLVLAAMLTGTATLRLRVWNPSRSVASRQEEKSAAPREKTAARHRAIWSNPVLWREIRTRAYGRKMFVIKAAYLLLAGGVVSALSGPADSVLLGEMAIPPLGLAYFGLGLLGLMLINAQAVTALTGERDGKTLELLLVTDITAKEFVFGKLGGILYNTKELILVPLGLVGYLLAQGAVSPENFAYSVIGFLVLVAFAAMLGLHAGLSYENSRSAIANSLGTVFFLFVGIFIFMLLLVEARASFILQFQSFLVFIVVGSIGLYASLTRKNPSTALAIAAGVLPFMTFYSITSSLLGGNLGVCIAISVAYGFPTAAMLIPAVSDFDVALGRTTLDKG